MTTTDRESTDAIHGVRVTDDRLIVDLADGRILSVPLTSFPRLLAATPEQRAHWRLSGGGFGIHWPEVDEDISAEGLLRGAPASRGPSRTGA